MNANTAEVVQRLATALGTTSEYLWGVLLKQAPIYAYTSTLEIIAIGIGVYVYAKNFKRLSEWFDDEIAQGLVMGMITVVVAVTAIAAFLTLSTIATAILNPEYFALSKVLSALKTK